MGEFTAQNPNSIQKMFEKISAQYDLANSILSFGIHHWWKKRLVKASGVKAGHAVLDCATGTGDLAFLWENSLKGTGEIIGSDFCEPMLQIAREKALKRKSVAHFEWGDLMNLPYSDSKFDLASVSFGIRNVKDPLKALQELGRVVKPGGKVLILEFGQPQSRLVSTLFGFYSQWILPWVGGLLSGQPQAYRYLQTSSATFPCGDDFLKLAQSTGAFSKLRWTRFQTGVAFLYLLERTAAPR